MSAKTSIVNESDGLVLGERPITVSDEKLVSILMRIYERARNDASKFQWYEMYQVCWSVFFTLFLTLVTTGVSDFRSPFSDKILMGAFVIKSICWTITAILFVVGLVSVIWRMKCKVNNQNQERDEAVNDCLERYCVKTNLEMSCFV